MWLGRAGVWDGEIQISAGLEYRRSTIMRWEGKRATYTEKTPRLTAVKKDTLKTFPLLPGSKGKLFCDE